MRANVEFHICHAQTLNDYPILMMVKMIMIIVVEMMIIDSDDHVDNEGDGNI